MKLVVIGIGQSLRGDDAAGLEAVRVWREKYQETAGRVRVELTELPGLGLLDLLEGMDAAILVDAVNLSTSSGKVIRLDSHELAKYTPDALSAHGWGIAETLFLGRTLDPVLAHCRIILIGIVGKDFGMGSVMSPQVNTALEEAAELIEREIQKCNN